MAEIDIQQRPRTRTMASSESRWSHKSKKSDSSRKMDLTELSSDKFHITGKADPSKALTELQPAAEALQESTLGNLRKESFTGRDGLLIQEPDSSNPTRYKWERPLQTIAGFEDDINRTYRDKVMSHHQSYTRPQSRGDFGRGPESRRSSYFGVYNQHGYQTGSYYRNGYDNSGDEGQGYQGGYSGPPTGGGYGNPYGPNRYSRGFSDSGYGGSRQAGDYQHPQHYGPQPYQNPYQAQQANAYQSREAVSASPETDQMNFSTDPSSYGSSFDQMGNSLLGQGTPKPLPQAPISEDPVSPTTYQAPRVPMKLNTGVDGQDGGYEQHHQPKRGSWFKRRFSKD